LERRGKGPPKLAQPPRDGFSEALFRCAEARAWLEAEVAKQAADAEAEALQAALAQEPQPDVDPEVPISRRMNHLPPERLLPTEVDALGRPIPATTLLNERLQRLSDELGPLPGF
jgi:hypothetical protein